MVIQNLAQLNAVNGNLSGYYVLGSDIRGAGTVQSIGAGQGGFKGLFDGLGNKLVNLTVQNPDSVAGLFSESSGTLRNLILDNVSGTGSRHIQRHLDRHQHGHHLQRPHRQRPALRL